MSIEGVTSATPGTVALWAVVVLTSMAVITGRRRALVAGFLFALVASVVLGYALVANDFSLAYVVKTTSLSTPWPYRLSALWGGMEGSLLFYLTLTLGVAALAVRQRLAVRVAATVGLGLTGILLIFADPFSVLAIPAVDGDGLLAILQHPAMVYHPPILYLGLTVSLVPFALTVAHAGGSLDRERWRIDVRRWMYVSWTLLTLGMAAGANWAYVELGWGGYWAWDPVENTALMPWLAATVFLHSSRLEETTGGLRRWNLFMAGVPFALTVVGIYLTRSGVTGSIHSFAEDPRIGLVLILSALGVVVFLGAIALRSGRGQELPAPRVNRTWWLVANTVLVTAVLVFVAAGSIYPAVRSVFFDELLVVDTRFYVTTILPVGILIACFLAVALERSIWPFLTGSGIGLLVGLVVYGPHIGLALFAPAVGALAALGLGLVVRRPVGRRLGIQLSHLGMAIVLLGVAGSSFGAEFEGAMRPGDQVVVDGHAITLESVETGESERYVYVKAEVSVDDMSLTPEIRAYENQSSPVAEPDITTNPARDVIVAISLLFPDGETVDVSVFVRPLVWWVWAGSLVIVVAGLVFLFSKGGVAAEQRRLARGERPAAETTTGTDVQ